MSTDIGSLWTRIRWWETKSELRLYFLCSWLTDSLLRATAKLPMFWSKNYFWLVNYWRLIIKLYRKIFLRTPVILNWLSFDYLYHIPPFVERMALRFSFRSRLRILWNELPINLHSVPETTYWGTYTSQFLADLFSLSGIMPHWKPIVSPGVFSFSIALIFSESGVAN